ncbi:hypothetical protein TcCL_NonESM10593 [Trypanosoma cruzi]|nr:hypothetical protein TcCL_NonESM10593 [Trypanosoma cruzi]
MQAQSRNDAVPPPNPFRPSFSTPLNFPSRVSSEAAMARISINLHHLFIPSPLREWTPRTRRQLRCTPLHGTPDGNTPRTAPLRLAAGRQRTPADKQSSPPRRTDRIPMNSFLLLTWPRRVRGIILRVSAIVGHEVLCAKPTTRRSVRFRHALSPHSILNGGPPLHLLRLMAAHAPKITGRETQYGNNGNKRQHP